MRTPWLTLALALGGCASRAPPLPPLAEAPAQFQRAERAERSGTVDTQWWRVWADPGLQALSEAAQVHSLDLRQALARVQQARAVLPAAASRAWPQIDGQLSGARTGSELPEPVKRGGQPDTQALRAALTLQWEIDLFGAARAQRAAAAEQVLEAEAGVAGARLLLRAELAEQHLRWQSAQQRLDQLDALVAVQQRQNALLALRQAEGLAGALDIAEAQESLQALQAQRPALRLLAAHSEHRLALLCGRVPGRALPELALSRRTLPELPPLRPGQPAELLLRRPDLVAATAQARRAGEQWAQAQAERWPRLALAAVWGRQDLRLNTLSLAPSAFHQLAVAFTAPLFQAGRLAALAEAQQAQREASVLARDRVWLTALQEVESALAAQHSSAAQRSLAAQRLTERRTQQQHAQNLQAEGLLSERQRLDLDCAAWRAQLDLSDAQLRAALDTVQLAKALGGGWPTESPSP